MLWRTAIYARQQAIASRIGDCCKAIWVGRDEDGPCLMVSRCRNRACPECARINARKHAHTIASRVAKMRNPKMLTLTLKPGDNSLREQITFLLKSFNRLRQCAVWKQSVTGGIYVVEIKRHPERKHWHVHLHAVINAKFIDQKWISSQWEHITKTSKIVDIRKADDGAAKYLSKYVSKTTEQPLNDFEQWPYYDELRSKRLIGAFGDQPAINDTDDEDKSTVEPIAPLSDIINWAKGGDEQSLAILEQLVGRYPWLLPEENPRE